ncbi:hypothetical protein [Actinoplanes sp. M2I2]|uniref:hypothetical protein n=1 Tax=Actinoplanes sp. M2I2 TaxID=1734444 RepID=UPI00202246F8|nr:hypothetical protein [Actinoplanes sp. M2I2]
MSNLGFALEGAWKVLLAGLILGAGLPAVFALGIRSMAFGAGGDAEVDHAAPHPVGRVVAYALFVLVVLVALMGIIFIVASGFGKTLSFEHIYPTIVDN